jgi:hypothetical protein
VVSYLDQDWVHVPLRLSTTLETAEDTRPAVAPQRGSNQQLARSTVGRAAPTGLSGAISIDRGATRRPGGSRALRARARPGRRRPTAMLRQTTKAVDAAPRRARSLMPEPRRPGWADAPRMSRSVLAVPGMLALHERLEHAAARPVIVPEMIVCDHGSVEAVPDGDGVQARDAGVRSRVHHPSRPESGRPECRCVGGQLGEWF